MPSGKYYHGFLPANTATATALTPENKVRTVTVECFNVGSASASLKIYSAATTTVTDAKLAEKPVTLNATDGYYIRSGVIVPEGEQIVLWTSGASVTARVTGFEEDK